MMASSMLQGVGFGAGSTLGRAAMGSVMGSSSEYATQAAPSESQASEQKNACDGAAKAFGACLSKHAEDLQRCQAYADALTMCKRGELQ